jgi:hypothetical protein
MMTLKFLAKGALGPLSGFAWPVPRGGAPGAWVDVEGPLTQCANGVHVCRTIDLAHWINDELWELEVEGEQFDGVDCLVVRHARLLRRIDTWDGPGQLSFAEACIEHAAMETGGTAATDEVRALLEDARLMKASDYVALSAFTAAVAVSRLGSEGDREVAYRRERTWQSMWITEQILKPQRS